MQKEIKKITLSSIYLALAIILPVYFHQVTTELASALSPMHIPILILGLLVGPIYGGITGFIAPILASFINNRPPLYPMGLTMAFELLVYGLVTGYIYKCNKLIKNDKIRLYTALIVAMLLGRITYGFVSAILTFLFNATSFKGIVAWATSMFVSGFIGIIMHIILVPLIVLAIERYKNLEEDIE